MNTQTPARELTDQHWAQLGDGIVRVFDQWCRTHLLAADELVTTVRAR